MKESGEVEQLREAGAEFSRAMNQLLSFRTVAKLDPRARAALAQLLNEGASIKSAIRAATQMIDGAKRWIGRTFQTDVMESIPFAPEIVSTTAASAVAAIEHFLDRARAILPHLVLLQKKFNELPEEKRTQLAAVETEAPKANITPALVLLAILGGLIFLYNRGQS
jgi:hypothetical protein